MNGPVDREFDIILYGASGFTGRLVAKYLVETQECGANAARLAFAGRDQDKLLSLAQELGVQSIPTLSAELQDSVALSSLVRKGKVVVSTVGPYGRHGESLVRACVEAGTHYCDLTGEVHFIRRMIDRYEAAATKSGTRIVHSCGYDSIPSDLGTLFLQEEMKRALGVLPQAVIAAAGRTSGGFSGGTVASLLDVLAEAKRDPAVRKILGDSYSLNPVGRRGPAIGDQLGVRFSRDLAGWTAPFVMASINSRVVRRSQALLEQKGYRDFRYHECMTFGSGFKGFCLSAAASLLMPLALLALSFPPTRRMVLRRLPKPGTGPSEQRRESGFFNHHLVGSNGRRRFEVRVSGSKDPGYGSTAIMLAESALCLALDENALPVGGGILTPASSMGRVLMERLMRAGLQFQVVVAR